MVFALAGLLFATWFSRIPKVRDSLELQPSTLGAILLVGAGGSLLAMPLTGLVVNRIGARATVILGSSLACLGMAGAASAAQWGTPAHLAPALFVAMMGIGTCDVAMNFAGARVEQGLRRAIMPWFHAGFSLGSVAGAALGTLAARANLDLIVHIGAIGVIVALTTFAVSFGFLPELPKPKSMDDDGAPDSSRPSRPWWAGWAEPRTVLVGVIVLAAALTEGAAADWLALAVVDGFGVGNDTGALGFTIFVVAMTVVRFAGVFLLAVFSRVVVLRTSVALAITGLAMFTLSTDLRVALVGVVLWGAGAALGFPIGMSAASDDPEYAATRLSTVATIGYVAMLAGPPALGLLADHVGYRMALLAIMVPLLAGLMATKAATPTEPTRPPDPAGPTAPAGPPPQPRR